MQGFQPVGTSSTRLQNYGLFHHCINSRITGAYNNWIRTIKIGKLKYNIAILYKAVF